MLCTVSAALTRMVDASAPRRYAVFERFSVPGDKRGQTLWYYRVLCEVYQSTEYQTRDPRLRRWTVGLCELEWFDAQRGAGKTPESIVQTDARTVQR